jgi:hypothetical protein
MKGGWNVVTYGLPLLHFFGPFLFLLSRHIKRNRTTLAIGAVWVLCVQIMDIYWLVMPNFAAHGEHSAGPQFAPSLLDLTALVGVAGIFLAVFGYYLNKNKVIAVGDPRLAESMAHENY